MTPPVENDLCDDDEEEEQVRNQKGAYRLVRLADEASSVASSIPTEPKWQQLLHRNLLPDHAFHIRGIRILDGAEAVRFLKFVVITFLGMMLIHSFVALMVRPSQRMNRVCVCHVLVYPSLTFVS
jgi:hypothetical protein